MHFKFSLLLSVLMMLFLCSCKKEKPLLLLNDLQQYNLKGNVKSITEINFSTTGKYLTRINFNQDGFITEQATYNPDGTLIRKWVNEYDRHNLKLSRHCYVHNDSLSYILRFFYNRQGKLIWTKKFDSRQFLLSQYSTNYDDHQNVIKETFLGEDATFKHLVLHTYDHQNKVAQDIYIDSVRNNSWKQIYHYNLQSQVEEITLKSPKDSLIEKISYSYLKNGKVDKVYHYNAHMKLEFITDYTYDNQGNTSEIMEMSPDNVIHKNQAFMYNYDQQNNWTLLTETVNHQPGNIITRKIEYFN